MSHRTHTTQQQDRMALLRKLRKAQLYNQQLHKQLASSHVTVDLTVTPAAKVAVNLRPDSATAVTPPSVGSARTAGTHVDTPSEVAKLETLNAKLLLELNTLTVDRDCLAREVAALHARLLGDVGD